MASQITDELIQSSRHVKRQYVQIPKDQKDLFQNAWYDNLNRGQHPMLNVPSTVLKDLKDLHVIATGSPSQQSPSGPRLSTANSAKRPSKPIPQKKKTAPTQIDDAEDSDEPLCSSWPSSPQPTRSVRGKEAEGLVEIEVPNSSPNHRLRPSSPKSQAKRKFPSTFVDNEPQSSGAASEELDIEPLGFVSQALEPTVNRTASRLTVTESRKLEATPPSAQMPVATVPGTAKPPPTKKRRMDVIPTANGERELSQPAPASQKSSSGMFVDSNQNSLNTTASISSFGYQLARDRPNQPSEQRSMSDPTMYQQNSSVPPTYEGRRRVTAAQNLVITGTSLPGPSHAPPPAQKHASANGSSNSQLPSPHPAVQSQSPPPPTTFEAFKAAYPDYSATLRHFVMGLLGIQHLKRRQEIHQSLYDDYIRSYTTEYFVYVSECSWQGARQLLPGIRWYNENVDRVLYKKEIVRKDNLSAFLAAYPDEVQSVQTCPVDHDDVQSESEASDEEMADAMDADDEKEEGEDADDEEQVPEVIELDPDETEPEPPRDDHIQSPTEPAPLDRRAIRERDVKSSLPVIEPTQSAREIDPAAYFKLPIESGFRTTDNTINGHLSDNQVEESQTTEVPVREGDNGRGSPEFHIASPTEAKPPLGHEETARGFSELHIESPSEAIPSRTLNSLDAKTTQDRVASSPALKSPTPARPLASQENSHDFLELMAPSSPGLSSLRNGQQTQNEPSISPPSRPARPSISNATRRATAEDVEVNGNDNEQPVASRQPRKAAAEVVNSDEDDYFAPMQNPSSQQSVRLPSSSVPRAITVEDNENDEHERPGEPTLTPKKQSTRLAQKRPKSSHKQPVSLSNAHDSNKDNAGPTHNPQPVSSSSDDADGDDLEDSSQLPMPRLRDPPRPLSAGRRRPVSRSQKNADHYEMPGSSPPQAVAPASEAMGKRLSTPTGATNDGNAFATQMSMVATQQGAVRIAKPSFFEEPPVEQTARTSPVTDKPVAPPSEPLVRARPATPVMAKPVAPPSTAPEAGRPRIISAMPVVTPSGIEQRILAQHAQPGASSSKEAAPSVGTGSAASSSTRPAAARPPMFTSTMPAAGPSGREKRNVGQPQQSTAPISKTAASSAGTGSRASSRSSVKRPRMTKAQQEEESRRLQEFVRRKVAMRTPSSTSANKQ